MTQNIFFEIECSTCNKQFSFSDFTASIIQYGLILLDGVDSCWFGCTCPFCADNSTLIHKFSKQKLPQELADIYNSIVNDQGWSYNLGKSFSSEKWLYNSFPYHYNHVSAPFFSNFSEMSSEINKVFDYNGPEYVFDDQQNISPKQAQKLLNKTYCSYFRGCRIFGPATTMLWFDNDEIIELAQLESKIKKKIFPRYSLYDTTWEDIQSFCWFNKYQVEFVQQISDDTKTPLTDLLSLSSKKRLAKAYEFLNILDQPPSFIVNKPSSIPKREIKLVQHAIEPLTPIDKESIYSNQNRRECLTKEIWDNFHKDYIQDYLIFNADKFIEKFYELSQSISFSYGSIWELKEKCLVELHEIIHSKYQRKKKAKQRANAIQKQAKEAEKSFPDVKIISNAQSINEIKILISKFHKAVTAQNFNGPILLLGESGTGKTHFAKAIHQALNCKGSFIKVDCGMKSEKLFESELFGHIKGAFTNASENRKGAFDLAAGGVIFLDEIGNIPNNLQKKLLSVLEDRQYEAVGSSASKETDAFILAATNENLEKLIEKGEFKVELFYRLIDEIITIPPLRERKQDVPLFFQKFIKNIKIDPKLKNKLKSLGYDWPGNIRELIQTIKRIERYKIMDADTSPICFEDLPKKIINSGTLKKSKLKNKNKLPGNGTWTDEQKKEALDKHNGNKTHAAKELGCNVSTIRRFCKKPKTPKT